eukprot:TRINITY_DN1318_c0_g1_i2.p1 TRINITY_DN1318_c0_g1~~TRINITY_DN1318_c0_g1_i2.p1  ORF type:complete len:293 (+),score=30.10 TRINITY_DN1318_c0_g1_i2:1680-2558(+)
MSFRTLAQLILTCNGVGIPFSRMYFVHGIGIMRSDLGFGTTNEHGEFEIRGAPIVLPERTPSTFALYAAYDYFNPSNINQRLLRVAYPDSKDLDITGNGDVHLGIVDKNNHRCVAYQKFYAAVRDYYDRVGEFPPSRIFVQVDSPVKGPPFVVYNNVKSNSNFKWTTQAAKHELAHVVRHFFHGTRDRFEDVQEEYGSAMFQNHSCDSITNKVFAFNEGWAMYWSNECLALKYSPTARIDVAGNVAAALRNLQSSCGSSDREMVEVLKLSSGKVLTYTDFEALHSCAKVDTA